MSYLEAVISNFPRMVSVPYGPNSTTEITQLKRIGSVTVLGLVSIFDNWNLMPGGVGIILIIVTYTKDVSYKRRISSTGACRQRKDKRWSYMFTQSWKTSLHLGGCGFVVTEFFRIEQIDTETSFAKDWRIFNYSILLWGGLFFTQCDIFASPTFLVTHGCQLTYIQVSWGVLWSEINHKHTLFKAYLTISMIFEFEPF